LAKRGEHPLELLVVAIHALAAEYQNDGFDLAQTINGGFTPHT
jgi:hypothetical protein